MIKIKGLLLSVMLAVAGNTLANNILSVSDVTINPGGTTELVVCLENDEDFKVYSYDFRLYLPEGIEVAYELVGEGDDAQKHYYCELKERNKWHNKEILPTSDGGYLFGINSGSIYLTGNSGEVLGITLMASTDVTGTLQGRITDITYANKEGETKHPEDIVFDIIVNTGNSVLFDENSDNGDVLKAATGVDVRVKRTIKADQWSTICLPFAMTSEQVVSAFGSDVQLADFSSWKVTDEDAEGEPTAIKIGFTTVDVAQGMEANHPYMIKVSAAVNEFTADGVTVSPSDSHEKVVGTGSKKGQFIGVFKAGTTVPEECLFLSDNKFWYSTGSTAIKAFRGYFKLKKVIAGYYDEAESHVQMVFDESEATGISGVKHESNDDRYYNLNGQRVENPKKGLYIKNNKKVVVK